MTTPYTPESLTRTDTDASRGLTVLDFGTNWCGHCQAALPLVDRVLGARADVTHVRVEDGSGRPLGRSYRVKLWPTLVFLKDGVEVARVVRPVETQTVSRALVAAGSAG